MKYDDSETSCPYCSLGMDAADLCEHDDPMCPRCCVVNKHEEALLNKHDGAGWVREWGQIANNSDLGMWAGRGWSEL